MLTKPRTILFLAGIFLAGAVSGVFVAPLVHGRDRGRLPPRAFHERNMERLERTLELTPEQRTQVDLLLRETGDRLAKMRRESLREGFEQIRAMNVKIAALLTPEQRTKFEAFQREQLERINRHQAERDQRHGRNPADGPPPPPEEMPDGPPPTPALPHQ